MPEVCMLIFKESGLPELKYWQHNPSTVSFVRSGLLA